MAPTIFGYKQYIHSVRVTIRHIYGYISIQTLYYSLAGFSSLIMSSCNLTGGDIRVIYLNNTIDIDAFLNPIALILCYYALTISSRFILDAKVSSLYSKNKQPIIFRLYSESNEPF